MLFNNTYYVLILGVQFNYGNFDLEDGVYKVTFRKKGISYKIAKRRF